MRKNFSFKLVKISLLLIIAMFSSISAEKKKDFRNMQIESNAEVRDEEWDYYISINTNYSEKIATVLENAVIRHISFDIDVPIYIYPDIFSDLEYAVIMIRRHTRYGFLITNGDVPGTYKAHDGWVTYADIDHIYSNKNRTHHMYYIEGIYLGKIKLKGKMFIDIEFSKNLETTHFNANAYVFIENLLLRRLTKIILKISALRKRIDRMIDISIKNILGSGLEASYRIHRDQYTYDQYRNNREELRKRYIVPKVRKKK